MVLKNGNCVTVKELKDFISRLIENDPNGEPYEVWVSTGDGLSSPCLQISDLNRGDILLSVK